MRKYIHPQNLNRQDMEVWYLQELTNEVYKHLIQNHKLYKNPHWDLLCPAEMAENLCRNQDVVDIAHVVSKNLPPKEANAIPFAEMVTNQRDMHYIRALMAVERDLMQIMHDIQNDDTVETVYMD